MVSETAPRTSVATAPRADSSTNKGLIFHISLLYNIIRCNNKRRPWWTRLGPHLILGALPLLEKGHFDQLTEGEGVRAVVSMNQPIELLPNWLGTPVSPECWAEANVTQCFGTTSDFSPPTLSTIHACVAFMHEQIAAGRTTYVHCKAGRGRSTVVVIAYFIQHHQLTLDQAHAAVRIKRPHISLHPKQRRILTEFAASISES